MGFIDIDDAGLVFLDGIEDQFGEFARRLDVDLIVSVGSIDEEDPRGPLLEIEIGEHGESRFLELCQRRLVLDLDVLARGQCDREGQITALENITLTPVHSDTHLRSALRHTDSAGLKESHRTALCGSARRIGQHGDGHRQGPRIARCGGDLANLSEIRQPDDLVESFRVLGRRTPRLLPEARVPDILIGVGIPHVINRTRGLLRTVQVEGAEGKTTVSNLETKVDPDRRDTGGANRGNARRTPTGIHPRPASRITVGNARRTPPRSAPTRDLRRHVDTHVARRLPVGGSEQERRIGAAQLPTTDEGNVGRHLHPGGNATANAAGPSLNLG